MTGKWERVRLGDVCDIAAGQGAPQGDENYCKIGGTPFIKAGNLECLVNGVSLKSIQAVGDEIAHSHKLRLYPKGTIVFAKSGMSCVKEYVYELEDDCYVVNHLACILPNKMDATYIKYYFRATPPSRLIKDFGYPSIRLTDIANIILSVPDVKTQKRIAEVLDKASELIKKRKEQIRLMDQLPKSLFIEMFGDPVENPMGWDEKKWGDVFITSTGKLDANFMVEDGQYPFFTCSKEIYHINEYAFDCEALLLAGNNATADYDVKYYKGRFNAYQRTYVIQLIDSFGSYRYFRHILESKLADLKKNSIGTNTKYLTLGILKEIKIIVPPNPSQNEFADRITVIEQQKALLQDGLAKMETAYKALMQEYFG